MLIENLFSNVDAKTIEDVFDKYHIDLPENFGISTINIVIGPNGSGKTRFLQAIKELYSLDKSKDILYGYFPALHDHKIATNEQDYQLPECTLYDSMYMEDVSFSDFFKEIENHNEEFIPELLEYHSLRQKKRGEKALTVVKESFFALTGKELVIEENNTYIRDSSNNLESLSVALGMLSPGELILFYMSIFLAIQQNGKKNKVIILDEPESHLHPKALISFIKLLTMGHEFSEVWIATHNLFIIPEYQFENIIYIDESTIQKKTSTIYQSILRSLLGDPEGKVQTFFSSLSQWQYCEFIAECFSNPTVIDTIDPNDEQVQLFIKYLKKYNPLRVLDCGGGSGRLGLSLDAAQIDEGKNIIYDIFDKNPTYVGDKFNVYKDLKDIEDRYHCVVMMNFLHEVDPQEWGKLFYQLYGLMEERSYVIFVEVNRLSQGEMPNPQGFFILGREELEILFQCPRSLAEIRHKEKQKSSCILIPRSNLLAVNQRTIYDAIIHLQDRVLNEIKKLRKMGNTQKETIENGNSRHYAFLSQQYINAKLFVDSEKELRDMQKAVLSIELEEPSKTQIDLLVESNDNPNKLSKIMNLIDDLWPTMKNIVSYSIYIDFKDAINSFLMKGTISKETLTKCWKYISLLEMKHVEKIFIAALLAALTLMGDSRGKSRLKNNGYIRYLPEELFVC